LTADDFGGSPGINEAVERTHREGVLTTASLMVNADATEDAVQRARSLPTLAVGLHLVLCHGRATAPRDRVRDLVDPNGNLTDRMVASSLGYALSAGQRRQLAYEIETQFQRFSATGLPLDHVNVHKHFHCHPILLDLILQIGPDHGMRSLRLPREPWHLGFRAGRGVGWVEPILLSPIVWTMIRRLERSGIHHNDYLFGLSATGHMTAEVLLDAIPRLPAGLGEIYFHPATGAGMPVHRRSTAVREQNALLDRRVAKAFAQHGIRTTTFHANL
jgi:hopanoid biosynthesis associated protein HpnK